MTLCAAILCGFVLDLLFGDPACILHPVVIMGRCISALERRLRSLFPKTPRGEFLGGCVLAAVLPIGTLMLTGSLSLLAFWIHPAVGFLLQTFWCWQALAVRGLRTESLAVYHQLEKRDLSGARKAVSRIVGRDTQNLSEDGVAKAAVETVAENFSDGVLAPLFYMILGGAPFAMTYKAVNTMDSMVGYKNDRYLYFGRAAAKLDDAANYLPSRLAALFWIVSAGLTGQSVRGAWRIWRRDARNHASPNSAQTESACAGALSIQLAGPAYYFGERYDKPTIGDPIRPIEPNDTVRSNQMLYAASITALLAFLLLRIGVCIALGGAG